MSLKVKGMLRMLMFSGVGLGCWISKENAEADAAADLGRCHQSEILIEVA